MTSPLSDLPRLRDWRRRRASSWDRSGGNRDFWVLDAGETRPLAEITGPGCIRHIWMTLASREEHYARRSLLRVFWDGEATPSVEVPTGDFFGVGHGIVKEFTSLPLTMSPQEGCAFNSFFPMPFASGPSPAARSTTPVAASCACSGTARRLPAWRCPPATSSASATASSRSSPRCR